jgi:hypothetical protein
MGICTGGADDDAARIQKSLRIVGRLPAKAINQGAGMAAYYYLSSARSNSCKLQSLSVNVDRITALALRIAGKHLRSRFLIDGPADDLTLHRGTLDWGHFSGATACSVKLGT